MPRFDAAAAASGLEWLARERERAVRSCKLRTAAVKNILLREEKAVASYTQEASRLNTAVRSLLEKLGYGHVNVWTILVHLNRHGDLEGCINIRQSDRPVLRQLLARHDGLSAPADSAPTEADRRWWAERTAAEADQAVTEAAFHAACLEVAEEWGQWD